MKRGAAPRHRSYEDADRELALLKKRAVFKRCRVIVRTDGLWSLICTARNGLGEQKYRIRYDKRWVNDEYSSKQAASDAYSALCGAVI